MRIVCVALLILVCLTRWTTAEINSADTIEWISADANIIAVGKVENVARRGTTAYADVTLRVTEGIKGAPTGKLTFAMWSAGAGRHAEKGREVLVFLVAGKRYATHHEPLANEKWVPRAGESTTGIYDLAKPAPAYTTAWKVLRKRDELLAAVRTAAKSPATRGHRLDLPGGTDAYQALWSGSSVWITVPVDAALEQLALGWLASKNLHEREDAVGALAHFKSAANTKRLVQLLADPEFATVIGSGKPTVRRYLVRKRAHEVLTAWGVAHKPPVIDEPKP